MTIEWDYLAVEMVLLAGIIWFTIYIEHWVYTRNDKKEDQKSLKNILRFIKDDLEQLDSNLTKFFDTYSDPKYNMWEGGAPKEITVRENMWKNLWGDAWEPIDDQTHSFDSLSIN